ncbi:MAG: HEPN domain-containing protein [Chloroflexota bacterium]
MERSRDWMFQALGDLDHARRDVAAQSYDWAAFLAQQAAEKAVNAVRNRLGAEVWGHSVTDLLDNLPASLQASDELLDFARELDTVYISSRYPDALPSGSPRTRFTRAQAERMVNHAESIIEFCESRLSTL